MTEERGIGTVICHPSSAMAHASLPRIPHAGGDAVDRHRQRAPQLHEIGGGLLFGWVVGRRDLVQDGEPSQQLDLQRG